MLFGRAEECERLDALLDRVRGGRASALLVHGEPGIGKSALLGYAAGAAAGMRVLAFRGAEAESSLPFAGLLGLLRPLLSSLEGLTERQASVLAGALALGPPVPADRFAVSAAALSLVASAAEQEPLLVVLDDAHWLDAASLEAVLFVSRRLHADCVGIIVATRDPVPAAIARAELSRLEPTGLTAEAARPLLDSVASMTVAEDVAERLVAHTAGNPLALIELARLLDDDALAGRRTLGDPLPAGPVIEGAFAEQLAGLTAEARRALLVVAASMTGRMVPIADALAELSLDVSTLDAPETLGLITIDGGRVSFRHPLLRSVVYHEAPPSERRAAHRALAAHEEQERAAWHLANAAVAPDERIATLLEEVAVQARARSGFVEAGETYERAADLTPNAVVRTSRLIDAARCFDVGGLFTRASELIERAVAHSGDDPELGAEIAQVRARAELHQGSYGRAAELLLDAAAIEEIGHARASRLYSEAAIALIPTERGKEALEIAQRAVALAPVDSQEQFVAGAILDYIQFLRGERGMFNGVGLAEMVEGIEFNVELGEQFALACHVFIWHELFERARALADRVLEAARALSALTVIPNLLAAKAQLEFRTGNWAIAHAAAAEAVILGRETGAGSSPFALAYLAQIEAVLGLEAESRRHAQGAIEIAAPRQSLAALDYAHAALGVLELGLGNIQGATAELQEVEHLQSLTGLRDPLVSPWQPDLIEAYVRTGRTDEAWKLLHSFEEMTERTGRSWPRAAAHRCRGLLLEAGFEDEFEEAIRCHLEAPGPFELARTELAYGQRLRRDRRRIEARERLRSALESFESLGAQPWASQARQELAATGETARRGDRVAADELTPQEIQVAALVAAGVSNKEAAARLFISPRTVDAHLGRVYRKLDIHSRGELAGALAVVGISPSSVAGGSPMRAQPVPDASPTGAVLSSTDGIE